MKMNFNDRLVTFFSDFSLELDTIPPQHMIYLFADYVELMSLFSNQNFVTKSDTEDRFKDEDIIKQVKSDADQSEANDQTERFIDSIFRLLGERSRLFADDYPFIVENNDRIILKDENKISEKNKIYIYLLISSSLNIFSDFQHELTSEFELLCEKVLANFLPAHAIVKSFGKNSNYTGTAVNKIKELSKDMKVPIDHDGFDEISTKGTQEKGLDLVGWIPFDDTVPNFLSILVQCACGKDWHKKLTETRRYNNYFKFHRLRPIHSLFIPFNLVSHNRNTFYRNDELENGLIFERKRILNYLSHTDFFNTFESKLLVEECIKFQEGIV